MAPLTRRRSPNHIPTDLVGEYYEQRASDGGLLIAEATLISPMVFKLELLNADCRQGHSTIFLESGVMSSSQHGKKLSAAFTQRVEFSFVRLSLCEIRS